MIRTIYVVFTDKIISNIESCNKTKYMFLCYYDKITVGDLIKDNRYSTSMQVVSYTNCTHIIQNGIKLKAIEPYSINGVRVTNAQKLSINLGNQQLNTRISMESRNVSITLAQAREWYNGSNSTLRTLALNAFKEEELDDYKYIKSKVHIQNSTFETASESWDKVRVISKLEILAKYYNGLWKMCPGNTGYFIGKTSIGGSTTIGTIDLTNNIHIFEHKTVQYNGIVYFKNIEDVKKAVKILGDDVKYLF